MPWFIMVLMKLNNVVRLTAYVGTFVTAIFYLTRKVMYMYILAVIVNLIVLIDVLFILEKKALEDYDALETAQMKEDWGETNGESPAWILWLNLILPFLFIPTFFVLYGQTGLILQDNDKIAENETDFLSGSKTDPS